MNNATKEYKNHIRNGPRCDMTDKLLAEKKLEIQMEAKETYSYVTC